MKIIGALMLAAFFVGLFCLIALSAGIAKTAVIFGVSLIVVGWIIVAVYFLYGP